MHLILHLANLVFGSADISHVFPVLQDAHEELSVPGLPVFQRASHDSLPVIVILRPGLPDFKSASRALEVCTGKCVRHASLTSFLQLLRQHGVALGLISSPFCEVSNRRVLDNHLFRFLVLLLLEELHLHGVTTVHPRGKGTLFHPVVHLTQQDLKVGLRLHLLPVVLLDRNEALLHLAVV